MSSAFQATTVDPYTWDKLDPNDPTRFLTPYEHNFVIRNAMLHAFSLIDEDIDISKLQYGYNKILDAFPSLLSEVKMEEGKYLRFVPQPVTYPNLQEIYDNAPIIASNEELVSYALKFEKQWKFGDSVALKPHLLKIDVEKSKKCEMFRGKFKLVLYLSLNHVLADGTSLMNIPKYLNKFYTDPSFVIPVNEPQRVPVQIALMLPDECKAKDKFVPRLGPGPQYTGYLNSSMEHPPASEDRETLYIMRWIPPGVIRRFCPGTKLTSCFLGLHAFLIISMLNHQHPKRESITTAFSQIRLVNMDWYEQKFKTRFQELFGVRIASIIFTLEGSKRGFSVYEFTNKVEHSVEAACTKEGEFSFVKGFSGIKRMSLEDASGIVMGRHRVSNVGRTNIANGPIKYYYGIGNAGGEFGTLRICPSGQMDGSSIIILDTDKKCFSKEFAEYYSQLYLDLWAKLLKNDINYIDFIKTPEYKKLCELLDERKPDWMTE